MTCSVKKQLIRKWQFRVLTPLLLAVSVEWGRVGVGIAFDQNCSSFILQKFRRTDETGLLDTGSDTVITTPRPTDRVTTMSREHRFQHLDCNAERNWSGHHEVNRCQHVSTLSDQNHIPECSTRHQEFYSQTRSTPESLASQSRDQTRSSATQTGHPDQSHRGIHPNIHRSVLMP